MIALRLLAAIENFFFLILIAIVGLVRWIAQAAEENRNRKTAQRSNPAPNLPAPRAPAVTEEERMRKFMEALGVPTAPAPPPIPPRESKPTPPPRERKKVPPIDPFPRPTFGNWKTEPLPDAPAMPEVVVAPTPSASEPVPSLPRLTEEFAVQSVGKSSDAKFPAASPQQTVASLLAMTGNLREAVILREILGPPAGL